MKFIMENGVLRESIRHSPEATVVLIDIGHILLDIHNLFVWTNLSLGISCIIICFRLYILLRQHLWGIAL